MSLTKIIYTSTHISERVTKITLPTIKLLFHKHLKLSLLLHNKVKITRC